MSNLKKKPSGLCKICYAKVRRGFAEVRSFGVRNITVRFTPKSDGYAKVGWFVSQRVVTRKSDGQHLFYYHYTQSISNNIPHTFR